MSFSRAVAQRSRLRRKHIEGWHAVSGNDISNTPVKVANGVFISWVKHHGRSAALADALGLECVFFNENSGKGGLLGRYLRQFVATTRTLKQQQGSVVAIMLPPLPVVLAIFTARAKPTHIIADLHTGFFTDPKWSWAARLQLCLLRRSTAIVTNSELAEICRNRNVRTVVLHDVLAAPDGDENLPDAIVPTPTVVCPLSYANDEPVDELIEAARLTPEINYILTGAPPVKVVDVAPSNVTFVGYLDHDDYWRTIRTSWGVVALTTRDHTMQRAGYEALICEKAVLTSKFRVLTDFFEDAAVYSDADAPSIAAGVRRMIHGRREFEDNARTVLMHRRHEQSESIGELQGHIADLVNFADLS